MLDKKKKFDPQKGIYNVPYERPLVEAVDNLILLARQKGSKEKVKTEGDWMVMEFIFKIWTTFYPQEYKDFKYFQTRFKASLKDKNAISREGEAMVQQQLEIPKKFHDLVGVIFPLQKYDKKFIHKLAGRMPILKVPGGEL